MRPLGGILGVLLCLGVLLLASCGFGASEPSAQDAESISGLVKGADFGGGMGHPDSASCASAGDSAFKCRVTFGPKEFSVLATVRDEGKTVSLDLTPVQDAICNEVDADVLRLRRLAAQPMAKAQELAVYVPRDGTNPSELRRLFVPAATAFQTYSTRLATYQPGSDWGRQAKPVLLSSSQQSEQALQGLIAGTTSFESAVATLSEAIDAYDAQVATGFALCP
jgi:hypothetical protein